MADSELVVASAVILPEENPVADENGQSPKPNHLKRRQSDIDVSETDSKKRARVNEDGNERLAENGAAKQSPELGDRTARFRKGREEERKRGQRMFGALLGALGSGDSRTKSRQPSGASDQAIQRRMEIEKRAQERIKQMDKEPVSLSKEEEERLRKRKIRVQWSIDEQTMKVRHEHMLESARHLKTTTEPQLYYRPSELSADEQDKIQRQLQHAQDRIDDQVLEFEDQRREALVREEAERMTIDSKTTGMDVEVSNEPDPEAGKVLDKPQDAVTLDNTDAPDAQSVAVSIGKDATSSVDASRDYLHNGETVVEGEEDTVIY